MTLFICLKKNITHLFPLREVNLPLLADFFRLYLFLHQQLIGMGQALNSAYYVIFIVIYPETFYTTIKPREALHGTERNEVFNRLVAIPVS